MTAAAACTVTATHCWALARRTPAANGELAAGCKTAAGTSPEASGHANPCRVCETARRNPPHGAGDQRWGAWCQASAPQSMQVHATGGAQGAQRCTPAMQHVLRCCTAPGVVSLWPRGPSRIGPAGTKGAGPQRRGIALRHTRRADQPWKARLGKVGFELSHPACCGQLGQTCRVSRPHARGAGLLVAPKGSSLLAAQLVSNSKTICQAQRCSPDSKAACSALR